MNLPEIRVRFLDLDTDAQASECKEVVGVDSAERELSYVLGGHPEIMVEVDGTETWFMSEQVGEALPETLSNEEVTEDQRDRSVTLVFGAAKEADPAAEAAPPAAAAFCQDGILSGPGGVCCPTTCGACGGAACGDKPGGRENCCSAAIKTTNVLCTTPTQTTCVMPPPAPPAPAPAKFGFKVDLGFTQPTWGEPAQTLRAHTAWCASGVRGARTMEKVCCAGSCGQCGGPACASLPGGYDSCCTGPILKNNITCVDSNSFGCVVPTIDLVAEEERVTSLEPFAFSPAMCYNSLKARTFLFDASVAASCPTEKAAPAWYKRNEMLPRQPAKPGAHLALQRAQSKMAAKDGSGLCAHGVHSARSEHLCCDGSCGSCGGAGCERRKGGKARCCATGLTYANVTCTHAAQTACLLPQHATDMRSQLWSRSRLAAVLQEELAQLPLQEMQQAEAQVDHSANPNPNPNPSLSPNPGPNPRPNPNPDSNPDPNPNPYPCPYPGRPLLCTAAAAGPGEACARGHLLLARGQLELELRARPNFYRTYSGPRRGERVLCERASVMPVCGEGGRRSTCCTSM